MGLRKQGIRGFVLVLTLFAAPALFAQLDFDNFESYVPGTTAGGQGNWSIWDYNPATNPYGGPVDGEIVDTSGFATNPGSIALELEADDDVVRLFNGLNNGIFEFTADVYTPSVGAIGQNFFIFLNTYAHGGAKNWSAQLCLNAGLTTAFGVPPGQVRDLGGSTVPIAGTTVPAVPVLVLFDQWVELRLVVDVALNRYDAFYDGVQITNQNYWRNPPAVPPAQPGLEMRCMDLYNNTGSVTFWFDNVFSDFLGGCGTCCPFDQLTGTSDCGLDTVTLDWSTFQNPGNPYTSITINRDGALLDTVGGADVTYIDAAPGNGVHTYQIVGNCPGGGSWNVSTSLIHCSAIQNDTCATASTANIGTQFFDTTFAQVDPAMPPLSCGGTGAPDAFFTFTPPCDGDYRFDMFGSTYDTVMELFDNGAAPGNCLGGVLLNCNDDSYGVATASRIDQQLLFASNTYLVRCTGFNNSVGPGTLTIGLMPVTNLIAPIGYDCGSGSVTLNWDGIAQGGPVYDSYDVARNGVTLAAGLPVGTVSYTDTAPAPGLNTYEVIGNSTGCGISSLPATVGVSAPDLTATDVIFRAELPSDIDSVAALEAALIAGGHTTTVINGGPADAPCNMLQGAIVARLWYMGGTFPDDRIPTAADEAEFILAQASGKGVYVESGDWWGFAQGPVAGWGWQRRCRGRPLGRRQRQLPQHGWWKRRGRARHERPPECSLQPGSDRERQDRPDPARDDRCARAGLCRHLAADRWRLQHRRLLQHQRWRQSDQPDLGVRWLRWRQERPRRSLRCGAGRSSAGSRVQARRQQRRRIVQHRGRGVHARRALPGRPGGNATVPGRTGCER